MGMRLQNSNSAKLTLDIALSFDGKHFHLMVRHAKYIISIFMNIVEMNKNERKIVEQVALRATIAHLGATLSSSNIYSSQVSKRFFQTVKGS